MKTLLLCVLVVFALPAADWNQWRGPERTGQIAATSPWPASTADLEQRWQQPAGPKTYAGPLILGDLVIDLGSTKTAEICTAYDRKDGSQRWQTTWEGTAMGVPFFAASGGNWTRATPISDGTVLIVPGMRETLRCLDLATGAERWALDFPATYQTKLPSFGFSSSPMIHDGAVIVQAAGSVLALDLADGRERWRTKTEGGGMSGGAFSSPMVVSDDQGPFMLVQTRNRLLGMDPTGTITWSKKIPAFRGMNILTPTVQGERIFTASYGGGSFCLTMNPDRTGVSTAWKIKDQAYMSSPVIHDEHIYYLRRDRRASCLRLADGVVTWTSKEAFGEYWSLIKRGDAALALDQRGILYHLALDPTGLKILDQRTIAKETTWAHLAISDQDLVIRGLTTLTCWRF